MKDQLTSKSINNDHSAHAGLTVYYGMDGRDVVMVVMNREVGRMTITGDVLGNGKNRNACEKALWVAYRERFSI